jgi:hypothetical protein
MAEAFHSEAEAVNALVAHIASCEAKGDSVDYKIQWEVLASTQPDQREVATQVAESIWKSTDYRFRCAILKRYLQANILTGHAALRTSKTAYLKGCTAVRPLQIGESAGQARNLM